MKRKRQDKNKKVDVRERDFREWQRLFLLS